MIIGRWDRRTQGQVVKIKPPPGGAAEGEKQIGAAIRPGQ